MPELPEVETIRRGLTPLLQGRTIREVEVRERRLREPALPRQLRLVCGGRIESVRRHSKYLLLDTSVGRTLLIHLGMSGRLWVSLPGKPRRPHEHIVFHLDDGRQLRFADARRFGMVKCLSTATLDRHPRLRGLGPDPFDGALDGAALYRTTRRHRKPVKNFLLDTRSIAGVGNIYACEALHRGAVHPNRAVGRIGQARWSGLLDALRAVLGEAIDAGGTTLRDFMGAEEEAGFFALKLRVYDREGAPCPRCAAPIRRIVQAGRSTFYCAACQR